MSPLVSSVLAATPAPPRIPTPQVAWSALVPIVVLLVGGLLLLTIASLTRKRPGTRWYAPYTVAVAVVAGLSILPLWARVQGWGALVWWHLPASSPKGPFTTVAGAVGIDGFSLFVGMVLCATVVLGALFADGYLRREDLNGPEFYALVLIAASGGLVMAMADDFIVLFLGLETLSIAAYVLSAMHLRRIQSQEAGLKYFVLGAFSSAFLLYGIALLYGGTGSTSLIGIRNFFGAGTADGVAVNGHVPVHGGLILLGLALVIVGLGFKVAAVPFHQWSPDVYDGAPTPSVVFMAGAVKAAAFAALVRVFVVTFPNYVTSWRPVLIALAVLSMAVGSVLAIVQSNVKRMLAYSSINHAGFILMAISANSALGTQAMLFYVASYAFMVAGSFGVVSLVSGRGDGRTSLSDYRGLSRSNPLLAGTFVVFLLAQAGIPFTSGFFAKLYAIDAVDTAHLYWLALVAMISAVLAAALYLRVIVAMYMTGDTDAPPAVERVPVAVGARIALGLCVLVTLGVGFFPEVLVDPAQHAVPVLVEAPAPTPPPAGTGDPSATSTTSTSLAPSLSGQPSSSGG